MKKFLRLSAFLSLALIFMVSCHNNPLNNLPPMIVFDPCYFGHTWVLENHSDPTCMETGSNEYVCSVCGERKTELLEKIPHEFEEDPNECIYCHNLFYSSLEEFNERITLENAKGKIVEITLGNNNDYSNISFSENNTGYEGQGLLIGRLPNDNPLNKYGAVPAEEDEYTFIFKDGTITSNSNGYESIDNVEDASVYMLLPGNSKVVFDNVTFNNVVTFGIQTYTSPWSYLDSLTFEGCTFNGIVVGYSPAENIVFNGCVFINYINEYSGTDSFDYANNSNPIWMRSAVGSYSGDVSQYVVSMKNVVFTNNTVAGSRPVKFERIGQNSQSNNYIAKITILDNKFDMSYANSADTESEEKHMALYIEQYDDQSAYILIDDGNTVNDGIPMYTAGKYYEVSGTKVLDRNRNEKEITARWWKSLTDTFTMKSEQ